uniref:prostaglandin E synthase 3-like isoform X2 n=1 Tax=Myxine glutinosa TaxID=7769 RepID=UPI00358FBA8F
MAGGRGRHGAGWSLTPHGTSGWTSTATDATAIWLPRGNGSELPGGANAAWWSQSCMESNYHRTDRSVHCVMRKGSAGMAWPRLTKEKSKLLWLSVDFTNWLDWEDASDNEFSNYDEFSSMMNKMGCDEELPELDGSDEESSDSDSEKLPDLE